MKKDIKIHKNAAIGLPIISDSYKSKTPKKIKLIGDSLVFVGSAVTIIASSVSPPGWIIMAGGLATLTGRFIFKCIGTK